MTKGNKDRSTALDMVLFCKFGKLVAKPHRSNDPKWLRHSFLYALHCGIDVSEGDSFMASGINFLQCNENVIILCVFHGAVI